MSNFSFGRLLVAALMSASCLTHAQSTSHIHKGGWYVKGSVGIPFERRITGEIFNDSPKAAPVWNLSVGHQCKGNWVVELEGFYLAMKSRMPLGLAASSESVTKYKSFGALLNIKSEGRLFNSHHHRQYIGFGLGVNRSSAGLTSATAIPLQWVGKGKASFARQIILGNRFQLTNRLDVTLDVRYVWLGKLAATQTINNAQMRGNARAAVVSLGLRYNFN